MSKIITKSQLVDILTTRKGGGFVSITTVTIPKMVKKNNPFYEKIQKVARRNGMLGVSYERAVRNQLKREGKPSDFQAEELPFGQHSGQYLITYKDKLYLKYFPMTNSQEFYQEIGPMGTIVAKEQVEPYLSKSYSSRQGTEKTVKWLTPCLDSIRSISIDHEQYELV